MLHKFRPRRPNHATVAAYSALFVALGGTAWAAATIGPGQIKNDAVRSRHVKDGEVKNADLGANAVATGKVQNGTLLAQDFKAGQLPPPNGPVRLVKEPSEIAACPAATGEFCSRQVFVGGPVVVRASNYGSGYAPAGFYKDRSGIVHLRGSIKSDGDPDEPSLPAFVLPPGYRPTGGARGFGVYNSSAESKLGGIKITSNGVVLPENPNEAEYLTLDGIQFRP